MELEVTLMDGNEQNVIVDPATTSRELVRKLCGLLGMKEHFGFSVFVSMYNKVSLDGVAREVYTCVLVYELTTCMN